MEVWRTSRGLIAQPTRHWWRIQNPEIKISWQLDPEKLAREAADGPLILYSGQNRAQDKAQMSPISAPLSKPAGQGARGRSVPH